MAEKTAYQKAFDAGARAVKKLKEKTKSKKTRRSGLLGRAGAIVVGTTPLVTPTLRAASIVAHKKGVFPEMPIMSQIHVGYMEWLNGFANQFGFETPFRKITVASNAKGGRAVFSPPAKTDLHGTIWPVWGAGFFAMAADRVSSWIAGHGTKIPGTGQLAIGTKG